VNPLVMLLLRVLQGITGYSLGGLLTGKVGGTPAGSCEDLEILRQRIKEDAVRPSSLFVELTEGRIYGLRNTNVYVEFLYDGCRKVRISGYAADGKPINREIDINKLRELLRQSHESSTVAPDSEGESSRLQYFLPRGKLG
jgi:hypothetical protein